MLGAALLLLGWGVVVTLTGGIDAHLAGLVIRSRGPFRALAASLALFVVLGFVDRARLTASLDRAGAVLRRTAGAWAIAAAAALAAHGVVFGSTAVGAADAYGYVNQAYDWASGALPRPIPIPIALPLRASDQLQTPLGYRVGPRPHTMVPTYAPGLPLLMALALLGGKCGPFLVVPCFAALFVWFTFRLGALAGGAAVGIAAVLALVTSPVVLYQTVWPMSDIPAGALWTGALVYALGPSRRSILACGVCAAAGLLVRPNLLFVPALPLLVVATGSRGRERWIRAGLFGLMVVPAVAAVAALNGLWYGAATNSGYGAARELYTRSNIWPNLKLYGSWMWTSQSGWLLLGLLPLLPPFRRRFQTRVTTTCALLAVATLASYVSYAQFEVWWYLRFLMPAFGAFAVLIGAGLGSVARIIPQPFGRMAAAVAAYLMVMTTVSFAAGAGVFGSVQAAEQRYIDVAEFAAQGLPRNAALLAVQHGGSLRFYTGRLTLRFDYIDKADAPVIGAALERAGYHPYLVVDDWEIPQVRAQLGVPEGQPLPWPIVARMRERGGVSIFDMATAPLATPPTALEPARRRWCDAPGRAPI